MVLLSLDPLGYAIILEILKAKNKSIKSIPEKYNPNLNSPTNFRKKYLIF